MALSLFSFSAHFSAALPMVSEGQAIGGTWLARLSVSIIDLMVSNVLIMALSLIEYFCGFLRDPPPGNSPAVSFIWVLLLFQLGLCCIALSFGLISEKDKS